MEFGLPVAAGASVGVAWLVMKVGGARQELDHVITAGLAGLLIGRLVAMISVGVNPLTHPLDVLIIRGGVSTVGASLAALVSLIWSTRADRRLLDLIAPGVVAGMAMWHAGCLWRSSCLGTVGDVPWGWSLPGSALTRHPVEIYA
ncbi:MAG: prolipoprotein diacylglyceryl transferase family protein, partial [Acidimicrobiia bacterium]